MIHRNIIIIVRKQQKHKQSKNRIVLALFRTNQAAANILILFYLCLIRAVVFIHHTTWTYSSEGILSQWILASSPPGSTEANIAAVLLVFVQAIFINGFMWRYRIGNDITLLPGLFYALCVSVLPDFLTLSPILLGNTFLILSIYYIFSIYRQSQAASLIFDVGLWIGVASLFYFTFWVFIIWGFMGLAILRGVRPKEFVMILLGFIVPYILMGVYLFWIDKLPQLFQQHIWGNSAFFQFRILFDNPMTYLKLSVFGFLVFGALISGSTSGKRDATTSKFVSILFLMLLIAACTMFVQASVQIDHFLILAVPLGLLLSITVSRIKQSWSETAHSLLLLVILVIQYQYLLDK